MGKKKDKDKKFKPFSEKKQQKYERIARLQYGPTLVNESIQRWNSYTGEERNAIMQMGGRIYTQIAEAMENGLSPQGAEVQALLAEWHDHLRYFYEPNLDVLRGLGETYSAEPEFRAFFEKIHVDLPDYLTAGIRQYVDDLEAAALEEMIAADGEQQSHASKSATP